MKCKVCGKRFRPLKENKYLATSAVGVTNMFKPIDVYECFDCPRCGCQNFVNIRMANVEEKETEIQED